MSGNKGVPKAPTESTSSQVELNELLSVSAAHNDSGLFIGLRLKINGVEETLETTSELLIFAEDTSLKGFRCGNKFIPRIGEEIAYKKVNLVESGGQEIEFPQGILDDGACF